MTSYARLKKQLENLQAEVESARKAELLPVIKRMQREMATHGITPADLGAVVTGLKSVVKKAVGKRAVKGAGTPKYRDPKSKATWSGFGRAPGWIAKARDRTKFLINGLTDSREPSVAHAKASAKVKASKAPAKKALSRKSSTAPAKKTAQVAAKKAATSGKSASKKAGKKISSAPAKAASRSAPAPEISTEGQAI